MSGVFEHYRVSTLGQELRECLDELVESGELRADRSDVIFQQFDKAICAALATVVKTKAVIRGPMEFYKNHDDIWTFMLKSISVKLDGTSFSVTSDERTNIVSVTKR